VPRSWFVGVAGNVFHPKEVPTLKHQIIPVILFSAQYPNRHCKSSCCGPFEAEHPQRYQNLVFKKKV